jgi:erythromycin esterase
MSISYHSCWRSGWLLAALLLVGLAAHAQAYLNLGMEPRTNHGYPLVLWAQQRAAGGRAQLDSVTRRQGRGSLRLELAEEEERVFMAFYANAFPLDSLRGQLVTVSGWVRTRGFRGRAGVYAYAHTPTAEGLATDRVDAVDSLPADMDWRRLELRLPVKTIADVFGIGIRAYGSGRVWFDDLQVRAGGKLLGAAPLAGTGVLLLPAAEALKLNWDFERPLPRLVAPSPAQATVALDSAQPQHGRRYLRLSRAGTGADVAPALYLGTLKIAPELLGKSLQVKGYWRQAVGAPSGEALGFAYALLHTDQGSSYRINSPTGWSGTDLRPALALPPPGPQWTAFSLTIPISNEDPRLEAVALSLRLPAGTIELDNFQFALNGAPYIPTGPPTPPAPTAAETAWLRTALKPLNLAALATDFQDLSPLGSLVGTARLVGLGEAVPGSHELTRTKQRLVHYLASQKGFTGLAFYISPASGAALNSYIQTGQGNPAHLLAALGSTWQTVETLDLLRWLRAYNQAHPGGKLFVVGLDVRQPEQALTQFQQTIQPTDEFSQTRLRQLAPLLAATAHPSGTDLNLRRHPDQATDSLLPAVRRLLTELAAGLDTRAKLGLTNSPNLRELSRQRYLLRLIDQGATLRRLPLDNVAAYRAACLAENVQYFSQSEGPGGGPTKLIVWSSTTLVAKAGGAGERPLGQWLRTTYGAGYVALALAVGQGSYTAQAASGRLAPTPLTPALAGTYEAWLRTGPSTFLLALNKLDLTDANAWLFQQQLMREADERATPHQFKLRNLRSDFDAVLFIRDSTPTQLLP